MITASTEITINRSTTTAARREIFKFSEAVQGTEQVQDSRNIAGLATETISLGGLTKAKLLIIDAKPNGGVENVNLLVKITNEAATGVAAGEQEIRVGSRLVICDAFVTELSITNLSPIDCDVEIYGLGD